MRTARRRGLVVSALLALPTLALIGTASAYFGGSGGGAGTASTGSVQGVTLSPASVSSQIYPGAQSAVAVSVTNPNPGLVRVLSLALDTTQGTGGFAVDALHSGCSVASLSYTPQNNGGSGWSIPGGGSSSLTLANALSMSAGAASACQGAAFTVYLRAGT